MNGLATGWQTETPPDLEAFKADTDKLIKATMKEQRDKLRRIQSGALPPVELVVSAFEDIDPESVEWLWQDYLPAGKLAIFDGDPGMGKSSVTIDLASLISRGLAMPDGSGGAVPAVVLLSSQEDGLHDTVRPRLDAAGADLTRVRTLDTSETGIVLPDDIEALRVAIVSSGARLLILDPYFAYVSGRFRANSDQDMRAVLGPLARLAEETGCAILVVRHFRKSDGAKVTYRGSGSIGIIGQARVGLAVVADDDNPDERIFFVVKSNLGKTPPSLRFRLDSWTGTLPDGSPYGASKVVWLGQSEKTAVDLLVAPENRPRVREPNKPKRLATVVNAVMNGMAHPKWAVLQEARELVDFEVPEAGWVIDKMMTEANIGWRWVTDSQGVRYSEWYPLT